METVLAYSKLNLTMDVLGKRPDGYHDIRSVMQFVDLADRLEFYDSDSFSFWCNAPELSGEDNLAARAYRLMERQYHVAPVAIKLYKNVPCQSGMGGGSADAAAVLRTINRLNGLGLGVDSLCELGKMLGADVPACIVGGRLMAEGIGERLTTIEQKHALQFVVVMPQIAFSTPDMYRRMDESGQFAVYNDSLSVLQAMAAGDPATVAALVRNSFEAVADPVQVVDNAKRLLKESGALGASMTGAGSAVFGIFSDYASADRAAQQLSGRSFGVYRCCSAPQEGDYLCSD